MASRSKAGGAWGARINAAIAKVDRPGAFCTSGTTAAVLPGLEVEGIGPIGLPLSAKQAMSLRRRCEQAPFGKGDRTLIDRDVRRVWRLAPDRFALTNPGWTPVLRDVVGNVERALGLEGQKLQPHRYELLLYEQGGFFLPHRDGEKLDRMVATLVVVLPSSHAGGQLIVRHEEREEVIDFAGEGARFQMQYAAFYADCEHEVKPLTAGYRLCLVYNLTLSKSAKPLRAPRQQEHVGKVAEILQDWSSSETARDKLAITLAHQYTADGLAWDALKGVDGARARVVADAARQAGCHAHLALVTFWESGSAEYAGDSAGRRRWGRGRYDEDGPHDVEMEEVFDSSLTADHWLTPEGSRPNFAALPLESDEIVPAGSLTDVEPEEDFEGYTGNAGMTLQRWYRRAAVVVWPDRRHFDILCSGGARQAVPALIKMVRALHKAPPAELAARKQRCLAFAEAVLAHWPRKEFRYPGWHVGEGGGDAADRSDPMEALERLGDVKLIRSYLRDVLVRDASLEPGTRTIKAISHHGWATFRADLGALFKATDGETIDRDVRLLDRLCRAARRVAGEGDRREAMETCRPLAQATVAALVRTDSDAAADDWRGQRVDRAMMVARLARALLAIGTDDLLSQLAAHLSRLPKRYPLQQVQVRAIVAVSNWSKKALTARSEAFARWMGSCRQQLEALTAAAPQPPVDFRREASVTCKCDDCAQLNRFLSDPHERERGFQMAQPRRRHLESEIRAHRCDLDCRTDKRSRPQILVCTKNAASHDRRVRAYHQDLKHLTHLRSLQADHLESGGQSAG